MNLPSGFHDLYQRYSAVVLRVALRVTGNAADAEDVLQTVFMRMLNQPEGIESGSPEAYLRRAATNAAIDIIRRRGTSREVAIDSRQHPGRESTVLLRERIRRALADLDPEDSHLFVLRNLEGFSYEELAAMFGIERGTVASRLHRIRQALRESISE